MVELIEFAKKYLFLIVAALFQVGFVFWLITRSKASGRNNQIKRSFWDYYFIWPLLLSRKEGDQYVQRSFTRREWIGLLIIGVVAVLAIIFTWSPQR